MKKKLFLLLCALLTVIGVQAQADVTSTYIANPSFELSAAGTSRTERYAAKGTVTDAIYGWVLAQGNAGGDYENVEVDDNSTSSAGFGTTVTPANGSYYFFNRRGWAGVTNTLTTTSISDLPAGDYVFSVKYKGAYSANAGSHSGNTLTIKARKGGADLSSNTSAHAPKSPGGTYFNTSGWQQLDLKFTVDAAGSVEFVLSYFLDGANGRGDILIDDVRLYDLSAITSSNPIDVSGFIKNQKLQNNDTDGWTATTTKTSWGANAFSNGNKQQWDGNFSFSQTLSSIPNGCYKICAQGFYRPGSNGAESTAQNALLYAGKYTQPLTLITSAATAEKDDAHGFTEPYGTIGYVPNSQADAAKTFNYGAYNNELTFYVTGGSIVLGTKKETLISDDWTVFTNFSLYYYGQVISDVAVALPDGGAMDADTWYYYDIPTSEDYEFTSSAVTTLTYTADGTQLISEATGTDEAFTAGQKKDIALTNGRLYFMTSAATTLSVSYKYSVGTATADKEYIQPGQEVTVTWADATTNDPSASFAKNGTPNITFNGSSVDIETTAKGFSFTVPGGLTANTEYTLAIPADAFGYTAGSTYNAAQEFTLKTPALYDGTYYIKTSDGRYVSRGNNHNTRAIVDKYGIAVTTVTDGSGKTTFLFVDNNKNLFEADYHEVYADATNDKYWTVSATTGGFYIASANDKGSLGWKLQITVKGDSNYKYDYLMCSENSGSVFTFEATASHASQIAAMKDAQAASVATAIGQGSITTKADLDNYAATLSSYEYPDVDKVENGAEKYQTTGDITQTLTGLPNGLYKVSVNAFQRITGYSNELYSGNYDLPTTSLYANNEEINVYSPFEQVVTSDKAWAAGDPADVAYEDKYYPNNQTSAKAAMTAGNYKNEIYVNVTDGTLRFGIYKANKIGNADWLYYKDFAVTYYSAGDPGTELERSILSDRITAAYATIPEENVGTNAFQYSQSQVSARLTKIHTAEEVCDNPSATVEQLRAQTTIMNGEATAISQNAPAAHQQFYLQQVSGNMWADFSDGCKLNSEAKVVYFTAVSGGYKLSNDETNFVYYSGSGNDKWTLNTTTDGGATWTVEYLGSGKYALHSDNGYLGSDGNTSGSTLYGNKGKNVSNSKWIIVDSKVTMTVDGTAKKGTFCAPFDITVDELPEGVTAYTADGVSGSHLALTEVTETIPAGTPVILDAPGIAATTSKDFTGVYASEPKNTGVLKGVYATTLITSDDDNSLYIMQYKSGTTAFYKVPTDDSRRVGANRCYLLIEGESPARINLGEEIDPTAINAVKVADTKAEGLKDGKYLINGKIVLVKNGVMYSTNGQKLN